MRSPLAENLFRQLTEQAGVAHKYIIDSAGTGSWHVGERPDERMRSVAARHGLNYDGSARQFQRRDFNRFDLVVAMDNDNRESLLRMAREPEHKAMIRSLREFDPEGGPRTPVPDPYYGGINGFEEVYRIIERSCQGLLDSLESDEVNLQTRFDV